MGLCIGLNACTPEAAQWARLIFGSYVYNLPPNNNQFGYWNQNWPNNYFIQLPYQNNNYFYGNLQVPMPQNFYPNRWQYYFKNNRCYLNFFDQWNNSYQRSFSWQGNQLYWY